MVATALAGCAGQPAAPSPGAAGEAAPSTGWSLFGESLATLPPARPTIQHLLKLEARQVQSLLGDPDLSRRETPAQVWQYRNDTCVLIVFLYPRAPGADAPPGGAQPLEVRHAEVLNRSKRRAAGATAKTDAPSRATAAGETECLRALIKSAATPRPAPPAPAS
jgi:hypothetical protein